jgi:hypothetical protein
MTTLLLLLPKKFETLLQKEINCWCKQKLTLHLLLYSAITQKNTYTTFAPQNTKSYVGSKDGEENCARSVNVNKIECR